MSCASVSMIGSAVSEPPPRSSRRCVARSSSREWMIEDVAGKGLAPGRPAQQQRQLAVGAGVLREIVVDDQHVAAGLHEVLGDAGGGVRRDVGQPGRLVALGDHHHGVLQRPVLAQGGDHLATAEARWPMAQ